MVGCDGVRLVEGEGRELERSDTIIKHSHALESVDVHGAEGHPSRDCA